MASKLHPGRPAGEPSKAFTFRLKLSTIANLKVVQESTGLTQTTIIEKALADYFNKQDCINESVKSQEKQK